MNFTEFRKVELAKILKSIKSSGVSDSDYYSVKRLLLSTFDEEAVDATIKGLTEEDEFLLMCKLMGTSTHIIHLEQRPLVEGDFSIPDFLARFQPGCSVYGYTREDSIGYKCFVDVKATAKDKFKVGGSRLTRLRNFSDSFGLPLLFAVRFQKFPRNAFWIIAEDSDREKTSLSVSIPDLVGGLRQVIWDEFWFLLLPNIYFTGLFDTDFTGTGVQHPTFGTQREFQIVTDHQTHSFFGSDAIIYSAFLEAFDLVEARVERKGTVTLQILVPSIATCSTVDLVYKINRLPVDDLGDSVFNASNIIMQSSHAIFDRAFVDRVAQSLVRLEVLFPAIMGEKEDYLDKWRRLGGQK